MGSTFIWAKVNDSLEMSSLCSVCPMAWPRLMPMKGLGHLWLILKAMIQAIVWPPSKLISGSIPRRYSIVFKACSVTISKIYGFAWKRLVCWLAMAWMVG